MGVNEDVDDNNEPQVGGLIHGTKRGVDDNNVNDNDKNKKGTKLGGKMEDNDANDSDSELMYVNDADNGGGQRERGITKQGAEEIQKDNKIESTDETQF